MEEQVNVQKKSNKLLIIIVILVLVAALGGGGYFAYTNFIKPPVNVAPETDEVEKPKDDKINLKDDFYESINYETLKNAKIPNDSGEWSKWYDATKVIEDRTKELTDEILADPNYHNDKLDRLIELYTDYDGRDKRGLNDIKPYLNMVDKAKNINELNDALVTIDKDLDIVVFVNYTSEADLYDSDKTVLYLNQVGVSGVPLALFADDKYASIVPVIKRVFKKYFISLGYTKEETLAALEEFENFAKLLYAKTIKPEDVENQLDLYHKYTMTQINSEIKNLPINKIFKSLKVDNLDYYVIFDIEHYKALDAYYTNEHLSLFKNMAKIAIMDEFFEYTTTDNLKFTLEMMDVLNGTTTTVEKYRDDFIQGIRSGSVYDELQKRYEAKYFTAEDKKKVADLVEEVRTYYKNVITNSEWLSEATKTEAIKKLDSMKVNIGYQENAKDKRSVEFKSKAEGGSFIAYLIAVNRKQHEEYYKRFEEEASKLSLDTLEVNAYYNPMENSINFLAGFKELYENETDYYRLLGYFGTVIAHEISHGFDNIGSKFDENGKVVDWWTAEDKDNYKKLTKKIEEYYNKYEYMGFKVDGKQTLGENIADLGAMKAILSIAKSHGATKDDYKKIFEAYADLWVSKSNKENAEQLVLGDTHSPGKVRVNAVLSSMDEFYEVYDVKETDKMYVPKEDRVGLW